jgi:hypothetical protein
MTTRLSALSMLRTTGVFHPLPQYVFMACREANLSLSFTFRYVGHVTNTGCLLIAESVQSRPIAGWLQRDCSTYLSWTKRDLRILQMRC